MIDFSLKHSQRDPKQYQWGADLKVDDMSKAQLKQAVCLLLDLLEDVNDRQRENVHKLEAFLASG